MDKLINNLGRSTIQVAVGIISNSEGQLLIAKRPDHWLGGGFWEFPGGKLESNEDSKMALKRELFEEVGIIVDKCTPLIRLTYDYPERTVILHAWEVQAYSGIARGLEGQEVCWREPKALNQLNMLPANRAIVIATQLPDHYLITPSCQNKASFLQSLEKSLDKHLIKLVQLRCKELSRKEYVALAKASLAICHERNVSLMLNVDDLSILEEIPADGLHLRASQLKLHNHRPVPKETLLSASCHNLDEIYRAEEIGVDFIAISPVVFSGYKEPLGWEGFAKLVARSNLPVFALGGVSASDIQLAKSYGGQGIAARRSLWVG